MALNSDPHVGLAGRVSLSHPWLAPHGISRGKMKETLHSEVCGILNNAARECLEPAGNEKGRGASKARHGPFQSANPIGFFAG